MDMNLGKAIPFVEDVTRIYGLNLNPTETMKQAYLISDTHFGHEAMLEYCGRPKGFEELLIKSISKLDETDTLIHLGDICIGNDEHWHNEFMTAAKCNMVLVRGNHDKKSNKWYYEHGWHFVCRQFKDKFFGKKVLFSHMPQVWDGDYEMNIHGHFHNSDHRRHEPELFAIRNGYQKLIAVEYTDYKPVPLRGVVEEYDKVFKEAHFQD